MGKAQKAKAMTMATRKAGLACRRLYSPFPFLLYFFSFLCRFTFFLFERILGEETGKPHSDRPYLPGIGLGYV